MYFNNVSICFQISCYNNILICKNVLKNNLPITSPSESEKNRTTKIAASIFLRRSYLKHSINIFLITTIIRTQSIVYSLFGPFEKVFQSFSVAETSICHFSPRIPKLKLPQLFVTVVRGVKPREGWICSRVECRPITEAGVLLAVKAL